MKPSRLRRETHNEIIFDRIRKASYRAFRTLVSEITGNYHRVCQLLASFFVLCSAYVFSLKCTIQSALQRIENDAKECEENMVYDPPIYTRICNALCSQDTSNFQHTGCICYTGLSEADTAVPVYDVGGLTSWLREMEVDASLDDNSQWNDGVLMYTILCRVFTSDKPKVFPGDPPRRSTETFYMIRAEDLDPNKRVQNWSLNITLLNSWYPGLIQNRLLLHCVASSGSTSLLHVVEILTRLRHARRRTLRAKLLRRVVCASEAVDGLLKPKLQIGGPGMVYAKLNMKNEFVIKSKFPCPAFTVEFECDNGEIWRECSINAKLNTAKEGDYDYAPSNESETPLEIVRVTRYHYRIFYVPQTRTTFKISIKPGISNGGHIYGSPFFVQAEPASFWRETISRPTRGMDSASPAIDGIISATKECDAARSTSISRQVAEGENSIHPLNYSNGVAKSARADPDLSSDDEDDTQARPRRHGNVTSFLSYLKTRALSLSDRVFSPAKDAKPPVDAAAQKRRTYASVRSQKTSLLGGAGSQDLSVPSSRNLKIRNVIIHRYLNEPMPSLEKYLFGQGGFTVDNDDSADKSDAIKRWSNVSALLRAKIRMMNKNIAPEEDKQVKETSKKSDTENGRRRRLRLKATSEMYRRRRKTMARTTSDIVRKLDEDYASSSSSESGYDGNDTDSNDVDASASGGAAKGLQRQRFGPQQMTDSLHKRKTATASNVPRFDQIFRNQGWLTDIFLEGPTPGRSRDSFLYDPELRRDILAAKRCHVDREERQSPLKHHEQSQGSGASRLQAESSKISEKMSTQEPAILQEQSKPVNGQSVKENQEVETDKSNDHHDASSRLHNVEEVNDLEEDTDEKSTKAIEEHSQNLATAIMQEAFAQYQSIISPGKTEATKAVTVCASETNKTPSRQTNGGHLIASGKKQKLLSKSIIPKSGGPISANHTAPRR